MAVSGSFLEEIVEMSLSDSYSRSMKGGSSGGSSGGSKGSSSSSGSKSSSSSSRSSSKSSSSTSKSSSSKSSPTASKSISKSTAKATPTAKNTVTSRIAAAYQQYAQSRIAGMKNPASTMAKPSALSQAAFNARFSAQPAVANVNGKLNAANVKASYQNQVNSRIAAAYQQYAQSRVAGMKAAQPAAVPASKLAAAYQQYAQSRIAGLKAQPAVPASKLAAAYQQYAQTRIAGMKNPASTLAPSYKIDKGLLTANEAYSTKGYVPNAGKSGVTIGTGFDIGQQNAAGLKALGLSPSLVDKLSPYTGMKQQAAKDFLAKNPLSLTEAETRAIDKAVIDKFAASLAKEYETAAAKNPNAVQKFTDLPASVQSVAYSVHHQYGSLSRTPSFMGKLATNDYQGMVNELRNFGDAYTTRRNREADHLENGLKGEAPQG